MQIHLALIACLALSACATPARIQYDDVARSSVREIPAKSVSVVDLTKSASETEVGWSPGFNRMGDDVLARPLADVLKADLTRLLAAGGTADPLGIWIVDANFAWETTGADFIPIINIFSYGRSGRVRCDATLTLRRGQVSDKVTLEHFVPVDTSEVAGDEIMWKAAVRACYPQLLDKVLVNITAR